MADPLTLSVVASTVMVEGIKFLYSQAGEAIKRWRERDDRSKTAAASAPPPALFDGALEPLQIDFDRVEELQLQILNLRRALADYAEGLQDWSSGDAMALEAVDALRRAMEAVYGQRLTFKGEQRAASGPMVAGSINVKTVAGHGAAVEARSIAGGYVTGHAVADRVEAGGTLQGVRADVIGGRS